MPHEETFPRDGDFAAVLDHLMRSRGLTDRKLADKIGDAVTRLGVSDVVKPTPKTVGYWRVRKSAPKKEHMMDAIEHAIFGDTHPEERGIFRRAWETRSRLARTSRARPAQVSGEAAARPTCRSRPTNPTLLKMTVEVPSQAGTADDFQPLVELRYGTERHPDGRYNASIGIGRLTLMPSSTDCEIPIGPRYGDNGMVPGVKTNGGGWEFTPTEGEVLSRPFVDTIARFVRTAGGDAPQVTFAASMHTSDLRAVPDGEAAGAPAKLKAIVDRYLVKKAYPKGGVIDLGFVSVDWRSKR